MKRIFSKAGIVAVFLLFAWLLFASGREDWDQFLGFAEVDWRSWILDHKPPLWSYQLCAGSTRIGDPQSFGLSPLFLPVLLLGSFWGLKLQVFLMMALGWFSLKRVLLRIGLGQMEDGQLLASALSTFFCFGNFFLWHLHVGHASFALMGVALAVLDSATLALTGRFRWRDAVWAAFWCFCYFTGGFYQATVFLVIPSIVAGVVGVLVFACTARGALVWMRARISPLARFLAGAVLGFSPAAFRWVEVLSYQRHFPRALSPGWVEPSSIGKLLVTEFLPTFDFKFLGWFPEFGAWRMWEDSAFSMIPWIALGLGVMAVLRRRLWPIRAEAWAWIAALLVTLSFCLGDHPLGLHHLLNSALFHGSVRVVGRYQVALQLVLTLAIARWLSIRQDWAREIAGNTVLAGLVIVILSILSFVPETEPQRSWTLAQLARDRTGRMQVLEVVPEPSGWYSSFNYPALVGGRIVPNCGQAISLPEPVPLPYAGESPGPKPLIESGHPKCEDAVYVTQSEIRVDRSRCKEPVCLNLGRLNLDQDEGEVVMDPRRMRFCLRMP